MQSLKHHIVIALFYFLLAAILGLGLRSFYVIEIPANYRFIVHTHSHIALLGWVYLALATIIYACYVERTVLDKKYRWIFWAAQLTLMGMLFSFPFQGYALYSIIFSTLFLFVSYAYTWFLIKNTKEELRQTHSFRCIKMALVYMVVSSVGPWALGGIMATLGPTSMWYRMAIYFYLHFQYNGWMVPALLGLFLYALERYQLTMGQRLFKIFFWSLNTGIILSFFLSTLWIKPSIIFNILGGIGAVSQGVAFLILVTTIHGNKIMLHRSLSDLQLNLLWIVGFLLWVKLLLQLITAFPYFADLAASFTDFTIGYLHWTFLGVVSIGLFFFLDVGKWIQLSKGNFMVYLMGFILTESLIFYKGVAAWRGFVLNEGYYLLLVLASLLIVAGLILIFLKSLFPNNG